METPIETLQIIVTYFDGQEPDDVGHPYYVATCDTLGLTTDGETLDMLLRNLRDALELTMDEEDTISIYNVIPNPKINIMMELSHYAQIA